MHKTGSGGNGRSEGSKGRRTSAETRIYKAASPTRSAPVPPRTTLRNTLRSRSFPLPRPLANESKTISSTSLFRVYLASIYHSLLVNAAKTANKKRAGRPNFRGSFVYGRRVAPSFRNGESKYRSTTEGSSGWTKGRPISKGASVSSSSSP